MHRSIPLVFSTGLLTWSYTIVHIPFLIFVLILESIHGIQFHKKKLFQIVKQKLRPCIKKWGKKWKKKWNFFFSFFFIFFSIFFSFFFQSLNIQYDAIATYLFWCLSKRWHLMQSFNPTNISIHIECWEIEKKMEKKNEK